MHGRSDPDYPAALRELPDPPLAVFLRGAGPLRSRPAARRSRSSALAGRPTPACGWPGGWAAFAAGSGLPVVSGMALGIDGAAHAGALDAGGPRCGARLRHRHRLSAQPPRPLQRILEHGLVVSEYPPGTAPAPWRFPARNRLIAALAGTLVVVEARAAAAR